MPIIPRVNPEITQIAALPGVRNEVQVRPLDGISQAVAPLVGVANDIYKREQDKADVASYMEGQRKLSDWQSVWNDPENTKGIHGYKGREALKLDEAMMPDFDNTVAGIAASLPSERARQRFVEYAAGERMQIGAQVSRYSVAQNEAYLAGEREAYAATQENALIRAQLTDPNRYQQAWATTLGTIYADGAASGESPRLTEFRIQSLQSRVHSGVMDSLLSGGQAQAARGYYAEYADQFLEEDRAKVLRVLQPLVEDEQGEEDADAAEAGLAFGEFVPASRGEPSASVKAAIEDAAKAHGVPQEYLLALAEQESSFNPNARNQEALDDGDHAEGLFQYRRSTSAGLGGFDRRDPVASANAAAGEFRARMDQHGPDFAIAAHFAGDGGAEAVVKRGRTAENPKTARYLDEVRGRAARWRGPATGAVDTTMARPRAGSLADALERAQGIADPNRRAVAEAKLRDRFKLREMREAESDRAMVESINSAIWEAPDPNLSLKQLIGPERYSIAARKGLLPGLERDLLVRRENKTRVDVPGVVGPYLEMARTNQEAFAKMDVLGNARHMTQATVKELVAMQAAVRSGKGADFASESEQLDALVYGPFNLQGEKGKAKRAKFETQWYGIKREWAQANPGKVMGAEQRDSLLRQLRTSFALNKVEGFTGAGIAISAEDRAGIVASLKALGVAEPSEAQIRKAFIRTVQ